MTLPHPARHSMTQAQSERSRRFPQVCGWCRASILRTELRAWGESGPLFCKDCHNWRRINGLNPNDASFERLYLHLPSQLAPEPVVALVDWIYDLGYPSDLSAGTLIPEFAIPLLSELLVERGGCETLAEAEQFIREEGVR